MLQHPSMQISGPRAFLSSLIHRELDSYPDTGARVFYLALIVLATIALYYELYVIAAVSTLVLMDLHMTFTFFVLSLGFGSLIGAFGSLFAGLADRYGRANMVVSGLLVTGVLVAFVIPTATNEWAFVLETFALSLVEGVCLVATPALIRDFSPQIGRATAMGFWSTGPVLGSLVVAIVGSITIPALVIDGRHVWTHEYFICGIVGLSVFAIALFGLRELSPAIRDQLMVTLRDRALIELRARGFDVEAALKNHWRQLLKPDIFVSAFAVAIMLLIYYALVGFLLIYVATIFGYTVKEANNLGYWAWAANAVAVMLVGVLSDRVRVRKPFMVVGAIGAAIALVLFLLQSRPGAHPSFALIATLLAVMLFFVGVAYTPWMASFTETVEHRNPAATATGLAIWGWIIRVVGFASFALVPMVVNSVTPLVNYGGTVAAYAAKYPSLIWAGAHPMVVADAQRYSTELNFAATHPAVVTNAQKFAPQIAALSRVPPTVLQEAQANSAELAALAKVPPSVAAYMSAHGAEVASAAARSPGQWRTWYWICFGGLVFFLLSIPLLRGRWRPRDARRDEAEHEAMVQAELSKLQSAQS
jgi:MFS family permease